MKQIFDHLDTQRERVIDIQRKLVAVPALGPVNGGDGERKKADMLLEYLREMGITDIKEYNAPDDRVSCGHRPNITAVIPGKDTSRTMWIIGHLDVVPAGDLSLWDSDPFQLTVDGDMLIGRGVEDDHQAIVSGLLAAHALLDLNITPDINLGLMFVSDEETGSEYGLGYLAENHPELFGENDLPVIPDFGKPDSSMVEIAEKSMMWLQVTVSGKQCHASTPADGINAFRASSDMVVRLDELYNLFPQKNDLFDPPTSTFEPTKSLANVDNINTIPGRSVFCIDCRVLPEIPTDDVYKTIEKIGAEVAKKHNVQVEIETVQREEGAPITPVDSEVVVKVMNGIREVYKIEPRPAGIGGGTVAAILRRKGRDAVVWATCMHNAHQPNEKITIPGLINDAKVFSHMLFN